MVDQLSGLADLCIKMPLPAPAPAKPTADEPLEPTVAPPAEEPSVLNPSADHPAMSRLE